jgi:hypothetical protein
MRATAGADAVRLEAIDRLALSDLVHLYASAIDDRRFDDVVELFTDTAELRLPDPPRSLEPVRRHLGREGVRQAVAAVEAVTRTEHAIVGEVYAAADDSNYALGRITTGPRATERSPTWCGMCVTTTSTCARGPGGASTAAH